MPTWAVTRGDVDEDQPRSQRSETATKMAWMTRVDWRIGRDLLRWDYRPERRVSKGWGRWKAATIRRDTGRCHSGSLSRWAEWRVGSYWVYECE